MNLSAHFTTALSKPAAWQRITAILFSVCAFSAHAETMAASTTAPICTEVFQLKSSIVQAHGGDDAYGPWWFEPYEASDKAEHSLTLTPADTERFLGANNDSVLIRWHSATDALRWAQREPYLVVRASEPINDMNGKTLGRFVRLIAKARWDNRVSVEQPVHPSAEHGHATREWIAPLRIVQAVTEVDRGDRVVPRMCVQLTPAQSVVPAALSAPSTSARLLGFLPAANTRLMGTHNSIAIMDQGAEHGVTPQQHWDVVERVDAKNAQVTRQRAIVRIVQVLPQYSIIQIQNAEREVVRGAYLRRSSPTAADAP